MNKIVEGMKEAVADAKARAADPTIEALENMKPQPKPKLWPRYQSHKVVEAARLRSVVRHKNGTATAAFFDDVPDLDLGEEFMARHKPDIGGFIVRYSDGYLSFAPADQFRAGYTPMTGDGAFRGPDVDPAAEQR